MFYISAYKKINDIGKAEGTIRYWGKENVKILGRLRNTQIYWWEQNYKWTLINEVDDQQYIS